MSRLESHVQRWAWEAIFVHEAGLESGAMYKIGHSEWFLYMDLWNNKNLFVFLYGDDWPVGVSDTGSWI